MNGDRRDDHGRRIAAIPSETVAFRRWINDPGAAKVGLVFTSRNRYEHWFENMLNDRSKNGL
jgi:hypothetical protein